MRAMLVLNAFGCRLDGRVKVKLDVGNTDLVVIPGRQDLSASAAGRVSQENSKGPGTGTLRQVAD